MEIQVSIRRWSDEDWSASEPLWTNLLAASGADSLFLSWHWLRTWWHCFGEGQFELLVVAGYDGSKLVGVAPLFLTHERRGLLSVRALYFIGDQSGNRKARAALSEYLDVLVLPDYDLAFRIELAQWLVAEVDFDALTIGFCPQPSRWIASLAGVLPKWRFASRPETLIRSHQVVLKGCFDTYLSSISASSRRKIFNQRKILESRGKVMLEVVTGRDQVVDALADLNRFHIQRWGTTVYTPGIIAFFADLIGDGAASNIHFEVTKLTVSGAVVSVLHDIRVGEKQYNLQLGFDKDFDRRLSLGLLHLGYAIQSAAVAGVKVYDLLAGGGRFSDYKPQLSQQYVDLATIRIYRGLMLALAFRTYDWLRRVKQRVSGSLRFA